jgi:GNAT superfamily N-acetyltransferase
MIEIERIKPAQLDWVNKRYREVDFLPSDAADIVVLARVDGEPAGLGRLSIAGDEFGAEPGAEFAELGGMYVFDAYRGAGVSRPIIDQLIRAAGPRRLYCLPFAELHGLYSGFGFRTLERPDGVPAKVAEKYRWCNRFYAKPVLLMLREADADRRPEG